LLKWIRTIAGVGLSNSPWRPSQQVAAALQDFGYRIIPVNPTVDRVLGEQTWPDLQAVPELVDLVDVFRSADLVAGIVEDCIALQLPALGLQD
jgi:predicted CoA-binding protein